MQIRRWSTPQSGPRLWSDNAVHRQLVLRLEVLHGCFGGRTKVTVHRQIGRAVALEQRLQLLYVLAFGTTLQYDHVQCPPLASPECFV